MSYPTQQITPENPLYSFEDIKAYLQKRVQGFNYRTYSTYLSRTVVDIRSISGGGLEGVGVDVSELEESLVQGGGVPYMYGIQVLELPEIMEGWYLQDGVSNEPPFYPDYYRSTLQGFLNNSPVYLFKKDFEALVRAIPADDQEFIIATYSPGGMVQEGLVRNLLEDIEEDVEEGELSEIPLTWYNSDSMARRRPDGDYFLVEMIAPSGESGRPERVDIDGPEGVKISSLKLNMSPASLVINGSKIISRTQTLTRWVEEHWGDEMDMVNFNGSTFAFIRFPREGEKIGGGLCVESRGMTEPYKELRHLVNIYKMNGAIYQQEPLSGIEEKPREFFNYANPREPHIIRRHPRVGFIKQRLYIRIRCDFAEFVGFFESFDVTEDASSPYALNYNVSFKSEYTRWL